MCAVTLTCLPHAYLLAALPFIVSGFGVIGLFMIDLTFDVNPPVSLMTVCEDRRGFF